MLLYQNIASMFLTQANRFGERTALLVKKNGCYHSISWSEFRRNVERVGLALQKLGVRKGDRVALLSENRPEWAFVDLGALGIGAVTVPIYATSSAKEIEYVLNHSSAKIIFVSTAEQLQKLKADQPLLAKIVLFEDVPDSGPKCLSWQKFYSLAELSDAKLDQCFQLESQSVKPDDYATIIYTSGTTGPPKGVLLSHRNFLVNALDAQEVIGLGEHDTTLSFLPLSHVFERLAGFYFPVMVGATIAYAENMNQVPQNLLEVRPTCACAVPRLYEKIHAQVMEKIQEAPSIKKKLIQWAFQTGYETIPFRISQKTLPVLLQLKYQIANLLLFKKLKNQFGGRLRFFISGGAPLPKALGEFFYAAGIVILEGYGLTETSPVISVNRPNRLRFGTVGVPFKSVEVKIADDGEILVKGPSVMVGYYQDENATSEVIKDGWFYTGDIGKFDEDQFLVITDRKKDIIVTSGGKNVSPQNIENMIKRSPAIQQVVVLGDQHHYLVALVLPNFDYVCQKLGFSNETRANMAANPKVLDLMRCEIDQQGCDLANYEKIKYFRILCEELTQGNGELTPTLKVKRKVVSERYQNLIESMYQEGEEKK